MNILSQLRALMLPINQINSYLPKSGLIYEIGCGNGALVYAIAAKFPLREIIGIDLDKQKIKIAKKNNFSSNIKFFCTDAIKFKYKRFDSIIMSDFLHHLSYSKQLKLFNIINKHISSSGILIIKEIDSANWIRANLSRFWDFILYPKDKIYYRNQSEWKRLLANMNFDVKIFHTIKWFPGSTVLYLCTKK